MEHELYDYIGNKWSHRNRNRRFKENFGNPKRKTLIRFYRKTLVLGTSHMTRKVLQSENGILGGGCNVWFNRVNTGDKRTDTRENEIIIIIIIIIIIN